MLLAEISSLEPSIEPLKYLRNMQGFSLQEQLNLLKSRVVMLGLGDLGVLELLARIGVGWIKAADGDIFEEHNLNRQLLCAEHNLGDFKVSAARYRCKGVSPAVQLEMCPNICSWKSILDFCRIKILFLDALGGLEVCRAIHLQTSREGEVLVSAALAGETGDVSTIFPGSPVQWNSGRGTAALRQI